jgi:hypothetical protein
VRLILVSVLFFSLGRVLLEALYEGGLALGLQSYPGYDDLVRALHAGRTPGVADVWFALAWAFLSFYLLWTAVAHFKVGLWRLFGYDIEPYFQRPFAATNFVDVWRRYSYYYREFLVQTFYYPVFLRCFKKRPRLRIFVATFAAAGLGNLVYHILYQGLYRGPSPEMLAAELRTLPYYVLLGGLIAATQVWLVYGPRRRRRAWTRSPRIGLDVLAAAATLGAFITIRPFHHVPIDYTLGDSLRIVLAAFGIAW